LEDDDTFSVKSMYLKLEGRVNRDLSGRGDEGVSPNLEIRGSYKGGGICLEGTSSGGGYGDILAVVFTKNQ
jgi:hypothetical protein